MPRPNQGFESTLYTYVKSVNKKYVEQRAERLRKKIKHASISMVIDKMIDRERKKDAIKKST